MIKPQFTAHSAEKLVRLLAAAVMALSVKYLIDTVAQLRTVQERLDTHQARLDDHDLLGSDLSLRLKRLEGEIFYHEIP